MKIKIEYFAELREKAAKSEEFMDIAYTDAKRLYTELQQRYTFHSDWQQLGLAINHAMSAWDTPLVDGDTVVFIPKVAGG